MVYTSCIRTLGYINIRFEYLVFFIDEKSTTVLLPAAASSVIFNFHDHEQILGQFHEYGNHDVPQIG